MHASTGSSEAIAQLLTIPLEAYADVLSVLELSAYPTLMGFLPYQVPPPSSLPSLPPSPRAPSTPGSLPDRPSRPLVPRPASVAWPGSACRVLTGAAAEAAGMVSERELPCDMGGALARRARPWR